MSLWNERKHKKPDKKTYRRVNDVKDDKGSKMPGVSRWEDSTLKLSGWEELNNICVRNFL